jgi:hypothetical protein
MLEQLYRVTGKLPCSLNLPEVTLDIYIVRIYRYGEKELKQLFGVVEIPGSDVEERFATMEELWAIIFSRWNNGNGKHVETE